ncbi:iron-containing alcohol dehydrogenase [Pontibacillus sp. ALD_SL1]|uniref:iron-containing alcohol dehydrogenase n=1 Tax=Pontibacillus sp. ALD_SL1 TaxID=2777185 RepID=UPI001A96A256|nr:iron-containing alcohol dehydrogenase [Pontibacillus sp. ALD_SL1]QST00888.1 iron-containing alcohol dehydrogenase [Pontibacillus sp. ALD_SL1]
MEFQFSIPSHVTFGNGTSNQLGERLQELQVKKVLCVFDQGVKEAGLVDRVLQNVLDLKIEVVEFDQVSPNPPDLIVDEGAVLARNEKVEAIVAIGGGSAIDCAKAINILLTNPGSIHQYNGLNLVKNPTKPLIAIPTTAGTGSEVTSFTVITDTTALKKMVIGGPYCGATIALVDPLLTEGLPAPVTAATGMDALTHAIEAYVSKAASPASDVNALKAIELISENLVKAYKDGGDLKAREGMLLGSMLAAFAFNSAVLGLVHAIAHPLSAHCGLAHGVANAIELPFVMEFNAKDQHVQKRHKDIARAVGLDVEGVSYKDASNLVIKKVTTLCQTLQIPTLKEEGVEKEQFNQIAEDALQEISIQFNPVDVTKEDVLNLLEQTYTKEDQHAK